MNEKSLKRQFTKIYDKARGFEGVCYRGVWKEFANRHSIIQASGSFITGGRYNVQGDFGALYLSCDPKTCIEEAVRSIHYSPSEMAGNLPRMLVALKVNLSKILRLNRETILGLTRLKKIDLVNLDWVGKQQNGKKIVTQIIGKTAKEVGFEAILAPSATRDGCNLNLFLDKLLPTSKIEIINVARLLKTTSYEKSRDKSLEFIVKNVSENLTEKEEVTLFCSKDNIVLR